MSTYTIISGNTSNYGGQTAYCLEPVSSSSTFTLGVSPENSGMGRILWSGSKWLCVNGNGKLYYSTSPASSGNPSWTACSGSFITGSPYDAAIIYAGNAGIYLYGSWPNTSDVAAISYSSDGITWSPANSLKSIFGNAQGSGRGYVTAIGYNGTYFLAGCGQEYTGTNCLAYSTDGINWSAVSCSRFSTTNVRGTKISSILWNGSNWLIGITYGQYESPPLSSLYISSGFSSPFSTIVLTPVSCPVNQEVRYMAINPDNMIIATGMASNVYNNIAYSSDLGNTWNAITTSPANTTMFSTTGQNVIWTGTLWIASGSGSWPQFGAAVSSDGITWQGIGNIDTRIGQQDQTALVSSGYLGQAAPTPPPPPPPPTYTIVGGNTSGYGGQYAYCLEPVSSSSTFSLGSSPTTSGMGRILWSGDKWVCIAGNGLLYYSSGSALPTSSSWTQCTNRPYTGLVNESAIIYATLPNNSSIYLWGGWHQDNPTGNAAIYYSTNGITWSPANSIKSIFGNCQGSGSGCVTAIGYNGTYFLAGCGQEYTGTTNLAYSADGINWSAVSCSTFSNANVRGIRISSILWNGSNWLIGTKWGQYESPQLSSLYISSGFSSPFSTIVLNAVSCQVNQEVHYMAINPAGMIVATGLAANTYNNIAYSSDRGNTWHTITTSPANTTMFSTMGENVMWNGTSWIACGSGSWPAYGAAVSSDGITWQGIGDIDTRIGQSDHTAIASSGYSGQATPPSPPSAPTNLSVSGTQVSFTNSDTSVTNYQYSTNSGTTWTPLSPVDAASPLDFSFLAGGTYSVLLKAVNSAGTSSSAGPVSVSIYTPPPAPTLSETGIAIAVTAGASNGSTTTHYQWSTDASAAWTTLSSTLTSSGSFTLIPSIAGLTPGASQLIYVRAINSGLVNGVSASVSITIPTPAYTTPSVTLSGAISAGAVSSAVNVVTAGANTTLSAGALANTQVKSVNLAAATGITSIPEGTFSGCTSLAQIALPATLASISANSFNGCSSLSTISIPPSVTTIGANALAGTALTEITLTGEVDIGPYAFADCTEMTNATL